MPPPKTKICIFCGGKPLSREHIWSQWTYQIFPKRRDGTHDRIVGVTIGADGPKAYTISRKTHQGDVSTTKVKAVCKQRCNNGWMSRLEECAKPTLTKLMTATPTVLHSDDAKIISAWAAMKVMVSEYGTTEDVVSLQSERQFVMDNLAAPKNWNIWVASHHGDAWRSGYMRHSATLGLVDEKGNPKPLNETLAKNTQYVFLGVGHLLIIVLSSQVPGKSFSLDHRLSHIVRRIHPFVGDVRWPPLAAISDADIDLHLSRAFHNYLKTLKWAFGK